MLHLQAPELNLMLYSKLVSHCFVQYSETLSIPSILAVQGFYHRAFEFLNSAGTSKAVPNHTTTLDALGGLNTYHFDTQFCDEFSQVILMGLMSANKLIRLWHKFVVSYFF